MNLERGQLRPTLRRVAETLGNSEPDVQKMLRNELEPVEAAQRLLNAYNGGLHLARRLDDPALEDRALVRGELIVEAL
jgi:hypothetical protein